MPAHNRLTILVSSSHPAKPGIRKKRVRQSWNTFFSPVRRWQGAWWARRKLATVPAAVRIAFFVATILTVVSLANVVYQVVRTLGGYTGKPGRAKSPYFTGLSRSCFKVAEREGFPPIVIKFQ